MGIETCVLDKTVRAEGLWDGFLARRGAATSDSRRQEGIMSEDVTDQSLLDVRGLGMGESLDESALARIVKRILASSVEGPSNSFNACI
jgi:hypothetical protein